MLYIQCISIFFSKIYATVRFMLENQEVQKYLVSQFVSVKAKKKH